MLNLSDDLKASFKLESVYGKCLYSIQYADDKNAWTAPVTLLKKRAERFLDDASVIKVRLIFDRCTLELDLI